ncbi:MAG: hypothetical protein A3J79_14535 [Elusimicrobia bacterium RIFOXYB2_FULL_62_6]|nr:MAG: hypothetical protein A3J79_14535 [Elusimicrobia bacterium RIFOXYB2_FULL_62_6]
MRIFSLLCALVLLSAGNLPAAKSIEREIACPICTREFYTTLDVPDAEYEMRLDMKPLGALPGPWHIPDCPGCGFIIYALNIPKAELAKCKAFVDSDDFKRFAKRSSYYRAGLISGMLGSKDFPLAQAYLKASWQEEADAEKLKEDLELSLKHFSACAKGCEGDEQENSQLMMTELLRRLGRFDEARAHIAGLRALKGFQGNLYTDILDFQVSLCDKKDAFIHNMEEVKVAKMPLAARLKWRAKKWFAGFKLKMGLK